MMALPPAARAFLLRLLVLSFAVGVTVGILSVEASCTPAQREAVQTIAPAVQRATCVFVRALTTDGRALEACATADELAPFLSELLEARAAEPPEPPEARPVLAFAITPPKRKVARRRCASWVPVVPVATTLDGASDASPVDGGSDGGR